MDEHQEPSFGRQVVRRAWFASWKFFEDRRHDIGLGFLGVLLAAYQRFTIRGISTSLPDLGMDCVSILAPFVVMWALLFVWHFWLAPSAMVYDASRRVAESIAEASRPQKESRPINWAPWKHRTHYTLYEFAKILSKTDPAAQALNTEGSSYLRLLIEAMKNRAIKYVPLSNEPPLERYLKYTDANNRGERDDLLWWAESKGFPTDHIK